jgi:hypothetical protein
MTSTLIQNEPYVIQNEPYVIQNEPYKALLRIGLWSGFSYARSLLIKLMKLIHTVSRRLR